jgi:hypothetical protein
VGHIINEDIQEAVVVFANETDIPAVGTNISDWNLWTYHGGLTTRDWQFPLEVKENTIGRYIDVVGIDNSLGNSRPYEKYSNLRIYFTNTSALQINDLNKILFSVYPNPSNAIFNIKGKGIRKLFISNSQGQIIESKEYNNLNSIQIDLSAYPKSVYFATLIDQQNRLGYLRLVRF